MKTLVTTPEELAAKQIRNAGASTDAYRSGVKKVQTAPGQAAAQKKDKYVRGVQASVDKWASNVAAVDLQTWVNMTLSKGGDRYATGVAAAKTKTQAFWSKFLPVVQSAQAQVQQMPSDTYEQRKARAMANMDALHQFTNSR
jgi:hypothetical protein